MALHLLNPGLRPLGLFDLVDDTELEGGEWVVLVANSDLAAADSANQGPFDDADATNQMQFGLSAAASATGSFGGLADEGGDEYGTLLGSLIGSNAGQATAFGTTNGAVVIGPQTSSGSGKVTVWVQAGLYGVSGTAATGAATNSIAAGTGSATAIFEAEAATGCLNTNTVGNPLGYLVGHMTDPSLVSTTTLAAGEDAELAHTVVYFTNAQLA